MCTVVVVHIGVHMWLRECVYADGEGVCACVPVSLECVPAMWYSADDPATTTTSITQPPTPSLVASTSSSSSSSSTTYYILCRILLRRQHNLDAPQLKGDRRQLGGREGALPCAQLISRLFYVSRALQSRFERENLREASRTFESHHHSFRDVRAVWRHFLVPVSAADKTVTNHTYKDTPSQTSTHTQYNISSAA